MGGTFVRVINQLDWAKHQIREVRQRIEGFEKAEGSPFSIESYPRTHLKEYIEVKWRLEPYDLPLDELGNQIGDAVHNLRASLDYLVYELSIRRRQGNEPKSIPPGSPLRQTGFPIFLDKDQFERRGKQGVGPGLALVTQKQAARIKTLQPFDKPDHPLWVVSELDNLRKHRKAHVVLGIDQITLDKKMAKYHGFKVADRVPTGRGIKHGAKVVTLTVPRHSIGLHLEADVNIALKRRLLIQFAEGSPAAGREVIPELQRLQQHVTRTLNRFRPDFTGYH